MKAKKSIKMESLEDFNRINSEELSSISGGVNAASTIKEDRPTRKVDQYSKKHDQPQLRTNRQG